MEHQNRKYPRLKEYDYSPPGYYYVTIHNEPGAPMLAQISPGDIRRRAVVSLTQAGMIAEKQLFLLEQRYAYVRIDKYVIMPTHIHCILRLVDAPFPRPGLTDIIGAYKSLTTRELNVVRNTPGQKLFQRSFYETVIRSEKAYLSCWKYIDENPDKWGIQKEREWTFRSEDACGTKKL